MGSSGLKVLVLIPTVLGCLISLGLTGFGIWWYYAQPNFIKGADQVSNAMAIAIIAVGAFSALVSFLGIFGAATGNKCAISTYAVIVLLMALGFLVIGIIGLAASSLLKDALTIVMKWETDSQPADYQGLLWSANGRFNCCGIEDMPVCDKIYPPLEKCPKNSALCRKGCLNPVWNEFIAPYTVAGAATCLALAGVMILAVLLSCCLCCSI